MERRNRYSVKETIEMYNGYPGLSDSQISDFTEQLNKHIYFVVEAGKRLDVLGEQLVIHDWSKWTINQFPYYAQYFSKKSDKSPLDNPDVSESFAMAWLDHIHLEQHHWQHWIIPGSAHSYGRWTNVEDGVIEMPKNYVLEMVADWMGASQAYTGSWDMTEWLRDNLPKIKLHSNSARFLSQTLAELGYQEDIAFLV